MSLILTPGGHFIPDFALHPLLGSDSLGTTKAGKYNTDDNYRQVDGWMRNLFPVL
jgi:hypothetical protein